MNRENNLMRKCSFCPESVRKNNCCGYASLVHITCTEIDTMHGKTGAGTTVCGLTWFPPEILEYNVLVFGLYVWKGF